MKKPRDLAKINCPDTLVAITDGSDGDGIDRSLENSISEPISTLRP
jgi:hypothetical protein